MQVYKFKCDNTIKESAVGEIMNSILTNSSIGLFNTLREKEHLAYSVYSSLEKDGDAGMLSCNISTTTDNKDIGEISYDNVPKSIEGFFAQINALKQGLFTDQDIENAKLAMKSHLLNNEGTASKLGALNMGMNSKFGIEYANKLYDIADKITREDIIEFANKVFASNPVYSITATQDTLDYNKNYLNSLV